MAGEILEGMVEQGLLTKHKFTTKVNGQTRSYIQLELNAFQEGAQGNQELNEIGLTLKELNAYPDLLETLAVKEPAKTRHVGEAPSQVATTQQGNPLVENSADQQEILRKKQHVVHTINPHMFSFLDVLGHNLTQYLFGPGSLKGLKLNKSHK